MTRENVGGVPGGNNISWSRDLAQKLDKMDGKDDGKIDASIWNDFLTSANSQGNRISRFITIENAEKSFNYYKSTKDGNNVDFYLMSINKRLQKMQTTSQTLQHLRQPKQQKARILHKKLRKMIVSQPN